MELNALTRWESIGKDLYQSPEIARLKARSKHVQAQRDERQGARHQYDERLDAALLPPDSATLPGDTSPSTSAARSYSQQLNELEQRLARSTGARSAPSDDHGGPATEEERAIIAQFRALREKGKRLRLEEEIIERSTVDSIRGGRLDKFSGAEERWVHFFYRLLRRFGKGFLFGYAGKFTFAFIGLCLRHKLNLARLLPDLASLFLKKDLLAYGAFLGSFLSIFESSLRFLKLKAWLRRTSGVAHHRSARVILAAVAASTVAIQFLPADTRLGIAMFFTVRALEILVRWVVEREEKLYQQYGTATAAAAGALPASEADSSKDGKHVVLTLPHKHGETALKAALAGGGAVPSAIPSAISAAAAPASTAVVPSFVAASSATPAAGAALDSGVVVDTESSMTLPPPSALERARRAAKALVLRVAALPASNHFDTLVMALASAEVIWAWLFNRHTVEPVYLRFLDLHGGRAACVQHGYVNLHQQSAGHAVAPKWLDQINAARSSEGRGLLNTAQPLPTLMCEVLHRDTSSCTVATLDFFKKAYLRALPVYLPVYILPMLLFKHRHLLTRPLQILLPTALNLARSSLFLSSYCTVCWAVACGATNLGMISPIKGALAGFAGGCMVAIEKKGRRVELALYVLSQALPSGWRTLHQWGIAPMLRHGESACFVAAMSVILWAYTTRPHLLRSSYLSLFLFFFGSGGRSAGFSARAVEASAPQHQRAAIEDKHKSSPLLGAPHRLALAAEAASLATAVPAAVALSSTSSQPAEQTVAASASSSSSAAASSSSSPSRLPAPVSTAAAPVSSPSSLAAAAAAAAALSSPGALAMLSRHGSRLSTVSDEPEEGEGDESASEEGRSGAELSASPSASPSPPNSRTPRP